MHNRENSRKIKEKSNGRFGRIIVITGARQTGKTTLCKNILDQYSYVSVEDPVLRVQLSKLSSQQWKEIYPKAILDEIQKEPVLIETVKAVYDQWEDPRYVLLGSSQLLLMEKVRESLAGRCTIFELFPLTLPELNSQSWDDTIIQSIFQKIIQGENIQFLPSIYFSQRHALQLKTYNHYLQFGGYPAISDNTTSDEEKHDWLKNYVKTYLERDVRDLANFRELEPFVKIQKLIALNTGNILNFTSISKHVGISSKTVQKYIQYLEISYQAILLPAWSGNDQKKLIKSPKIHFLDQGVLQAVLMKSGGMTGSEFESAIISEIYKQTKNSGIDGRFYYLRTTDGREIDLLIEFPDYFYAIEIKMTENVNKVDAKNFRNLAEILNKPIKNCFILSNDPETKYFDDNIIAVHAAMFLG